MTLQDKNSKKPSNLGGPAARQGFKYQDHVAVTFILRMIQDERCVRVECETADDIVFVYNNSNEQIFEYIQVKTTEGDKKWSFTEATALNNDKENSSLFQKSLLCDTRGGEARFRIVSKRDIEKKLQCFKLEIIQRTATNDISDLGGKLTKKFKNTHSVSGRNFQYWVDRFVWQVCGDVRSLESSNLHKLSEIAYEYGYSPSHQQLKMIYEKLLEHADLAATADVITQANKKIIDRKSVIIQFEMLLEATETEKLATAKPYKSKPEQFLLEFHSVSEEPFFRALTGYDVKYDFKIWRSEEFAKHLVDWLPEFSLRASELINFGPHNARIMLASSISSLNNPGVTHDKILAELILHSILRHQVDSQPIACKVFYVSDGKLSEFGNAHIVRNKELSDELWLGLSKLIPNGCMDQALSDIIGILEMTISKTALGKEREIIISLREPQHHLPSSEHFNRALSKAAPVEDMLKVLCIPILLAYNSESLANGFVDKYIELLKTETTAYYEKLKNHLPDSLKQVKVAVYLIPMECVQSLTRQFETACFELR